MINKTCLLYAKMCLSSCTICEKCVFLPTKKSTQCLKQTSFKLINERTDNWENVCVGANRDVLFWKKKKWFKNRQIRSVFIHSFNIWEILCVFYCAVAYLLQGFFVHYNGNLCSLSNVKVKHLHCYTLKVTINV